MRTRLLFVERRAGASPSIENVFRQVAEHQPREEFEIAFQQVPYGDGIVNVIRNLLFFRPSPADVYHVTGHAYYITLRLPRRTTVLTIHDLILLHIRSGFRRWILKHLYYILPARRARIVTAISSSSKAELEHVLGPEGREIEVIDDPLPTGLDRREAKSFDAVRPVILHVGTAANKNLDNLVAAVRGLDCVLRIIGPLHDQAARALRDAGVAFENAAGLDREQMTEEYWNCDIVSFCSTYEGFGLPILEAQAMAKPLVTSDLEPMRYVAGTGAVLVDPSNPDSIRSGLLRIVNEPELREKIVAAGLKNIERFDAERLAGQYTDIYRRIIAA